MASPQHVTRIHNELKQAGVSPIGFFKLSIRYAHEVIGLDEHIGGVAYGWNITGSGALIATDKRIIYIDKRPLFTTSDELTYDVISGVKINSGGLFCSVILHTRRNDYRIRYANEASARNFVKFIEQRRIHPGRYDHSSQRYEQEVEVENYKAGSRYSDGATSFIEAHTFGILSTAGSRKPHGSVVQYIVDKQGYIYLATTPESRKLQNIVANPMVSLTVFELETELTARAEGHASIEQNPTKIVEVTNELSKHKTAQYEQYTQQVNMHQQELVVIKINPSRMELTDYSRKR